MPTEVMFVAMTAIICTFMVIRMGIKAKMRGSELREDAGNDRIEAIVADTQKEVARLKERVQVLEKLVTDDDRKLAEDIERLRRQGEIRS